MIDICPTVTASEPHAYREQMERIAPFALRVHIDLADHVFASNKLIDINQVWWPGGMRADLHVMYKRPFEHTEMFLTLAPQLVIVHAEAEGDFVSFAKKLHHHGIEAGVALLPQTPPQVLEPAIDEIDHVLIFSGNLGYQGGSQANLALLKKVAILRTMKPQLEIGWDGGVNDQNAKQLADGGIDVLNIGGYIQKAENPQTSYAKLKQTVTGNHAAHIIN